MTAEDHDDVTCRGCGPAGEAAWREAHRMTPGESPCPACDGTDKHDNDCQLALRSWRLAIGLPEHTTLGDQSLAWSLDARRHKS